MKCLQCGTKMERDEDSIVCITTETVEWVFCGKCGSRAEIQYGNCGKIKDKVIWKRKTK